MAVRLGWVDQNCSFVEAHVCLFSNKGNCEIKAMISEHNANIKFCEGVTILTSG